MKTFSSLATQLGSALVGAGAAWCLLLPSVPDVSGPDPEKPVSSAAATPPVIPPVTPPASPSVASVQRALATPLPVNRRSAFQGILDGIRSYEDAKRVYDVILEEERNGRLHPDFKVALLERAGAVCGQQFADLLVPADRSAIPDIALGPVMREWASVDPVKAVEWVNQAEGSFKLVLGTALIEGAAVTNPEYARNTFAALPPPAQAAAIPAAIDLEARAGGLEGIKQWYAGYIASVADRKYRPNIEESMSGEAFEMAAARVVKGDRTAALAWLEQSWDHAAAIASLQQRTPEYTKTLVKDWVGSDPDSLGQWLNANKDSFAYDRITEQFAANIAAMDPASAEAWVQTIQNLEIQSASRKEVEFRKAFSKLGEKRPMPVPKSQGLGQGRGRP